MIDRNNPEHIRILNSLPGIQSEVMKYRFGLLEGEDEGRKTHEETGKQYGMPASRVKQIEEELERKLKLAGLIDSELQSVA